MVDGRNQFSEGYMAMDKLLDPRGRQEFIQDLQKKVLTGYAATDWSGSGTGFSETS